MRILVGYASRHGSTAEVAACVANVLGAAGHDVRLEELDAIGRDGLEAVDAVVVGAPLYTGRWHASARRFLRRQHSALATLPVAVFALGPVHDDEDERAHAREQLAHALAHERWLEPRSVAVFGGRIDPNALSFPLNRMAAADARDWDVIEEWTRSLPDALVAEVAASA